MELRVTLTFRQRRTENHNGGDRAALRRFACRRLLYPNKSLNAADSIVSATQKPHRTVGFVTEGRREA